MISAPDTSLCRRVRHIAEAVRGHLPEGPATERVDMVLARLAEPTMRLAVGGRMNAGKSTLINALVGQEVAATAATECTMLVAWFRAAHQNRLEIHRVDGSRLVTPARPGGGIPADLSVDLDDVRELVVEVVNDRLASEYTVVDTPGVDALSGLDEVAMAALSRADAMLYVMPHPGQGEVEALEALRRKASGSITAATVIGVLSRVDELGTGTGDPWPDARRIAERYGRSLTGLVGTIVPVVGLLAQTTEGDRYTDQDTIMISQLAAVPPAELEEALYSGDDFLGWDTGPLDAGQRLRALGMLGRYGIRTAVRAWGAGATSTAALLAELRRQSGIEDLRRQIHTRFVASADRLRATRAVAALTAVADVAGPTAAELRGQLAELRGHPVLRQAELSTALADLATGRLALGETDAARLVTLATGAHRAACLGLPADAGEADIASAADQLAGRWRILENTARARTVRRHARIARELCEALYFTAD